MRPSLLLPAIAALWLVPEPALRAQADVPSPSVRTVAVDGHAVRVQAIGLEARRPGTPVVVFESGLANSLDAWRDVVPAIAAQAPVVAYDRAGVGRSEWDATPPTPRHVTTRLRRLLQQIGAGPPYILVGHSWGGMLARYHGGYHPDDVAGLVFVDPAPVLTAEEEANIVPFTAIGAGRDAFDAYWDRFDSLMANAPEGVRAEFDMLRGLLNSELDARDLNPIPDVPLVVIVAGEYLPLPFLDGLSFDPRAHFDADLRHRTSLLRDWALASTDGVLLVASGTTHAIPREDPELVIWAVERVLRAAAEADVTAGRTR